MGVVATGGTETIVGKYKIHTFTAGGNFVVSAGGNVEYLVVGGGGGSGGASGNAGGGGGAGGLLNDSTSVTAQAYTITIGDGGAGGTSSGQGADGSDSSFGAIAIAIGGGGGGGSSSKNGKDGGSGGGAGQSPALPGTGTAGQGSDGQSSYGAGGGASQTGYNGITSPISGTNTDYAGGGGRPFMSSPTYGTENWPLGGTQGDWTSGGNQAQAGAANSGAGGGARWNNATGKAGGSGIVIIRYLAASTVNNRGGGISAQVYTAAGVTAQSIANGAGTVLNVASDGIEKLMNADAANEKIVATHGGLCKVKFKMSCTVGSAQIFNFQLTMDGVAQVGAKVTRYFSGVSDVGNVGFVTLIVAGRGSEFKILATHGGGAPVNCTPISASLVCEMLGV